jgi:hypothetical protein
VQSAQVKILTLVDARPQFVKAAVVSRAVVGAKARTPTAAGPDTVR